MRKKMDYLVYLAAAAAAALIISGCGVMTDAPAEAPAPEPAEDADGAAHSGYANNLFDDSYIHTVDVETAEEDWEDLLANPGEKTKYHADVTIDGEKIENVGFSTKGNFSLYNVVRAGAGPRFSFKVNFRKFEKKQDYHGLRRLNLHNIYYDATFVRDWLCYRMFREMGADAPLLSYVRLTVNGEDRGLYMAVEEVDEAFLKRTRDGGGVLYKPESRNLEPDSDLLKQIAGSAGQTEVYARGANLVYTDDQTESYPDIFKNRETDGGEEDDLSVIAALKGLSEALAEYDDDAAAGLERYLETDEIIRYFAVHNFVLNHDSYTGPLLHNYYLCEQDGRLSLYPWDYNMSFGSFWTYLGVREFSGPHTLINSGIDTPLLGAPLNDRPMWRWIAENEDYLAQYHREMDRLVTGYFESGKFDEEMQAIYDLILPEVENDPTAFYNVQEFTAAFKALTAICHRRAESIRLQLDGKLSCETDKQNDADRVDTNGIDIIATSTPQQPGGLPKAPADGKTP